MQVSMLLTDGIKPETVNVWDFESNVRPGERVIGIDLRDDRGGEVQIHFRDLDDILTFARRIIEQAEAMAPSLAVPQAERAY